MTSRQEKEKKDWKEGKACLTRLFEKKKLFVYLFYYNYSAWVVWNCTHK